METIAEFLTRTNAKVTIRSTNDLVVFSNIDDANAFSRMMIKAGRSCCWIGGGAPALTFIARVDERR